MSTPTGRSDRPRSGRRSTTARLGELLIKITVAAVLVAAAYLVARVSMRTARPPATPVAWAAVVATLAGDGTPGFRDGPADQARFSDPYGVAVDRIGNVYVADAGENDRIRRIGPDGVVTTLAGGAPGFRDGVGAAAAFRTPSGLAADRDGRVYVADAGNHAIRRVEADGTVTTVAGDGVRGYRDGPAMAARFDAPLGVAVGDDGSVYVADTYNDRIRVLTPEGVVRTLAGDEGPGFRDGLGRWARFDTPTDVAVAPDGALLVADAGNDAVRRIDGDRRVSTVGFPALSYHRHPMLARPVGLAVTPDRFVYVTDRRGHIVQMSPDGAVRELAGAGIGFADGPGDDARFANPTGIALGAEGALHVADGANYLIRTVASGSDADGPPSTTPSAAGRSIPDLSARALGIDELPWPIEPQDEWQELTGTMGEARAGSDGDGRARFHAGMDVRGEYGTPVRAVRTETVVEPIAASGFGSSSEQISVGLLSYVHLSVGRDRRDRPLEGSPFTVLYDPRGRPTRVRVRRGTRIAKGDVLGTVNRAYHSHVEFGPRGAEFNPLVLSPVGLTDGVAPTIRRGGVQLFDEAGRRLRTRRDGRLIVRGRVRIVVDAYDQVDGNRSSRRLGLYRLGYQVLRPDGSPAPGFDEPRITIEFDRLPADPDAPHLVYAEGSGITVYGNPITRFRYIVTNVVRGGRAEPGAWDTTELPPGDYVLRVVAADFAGNEATNRRDLDVTVEPDVADPRATIAP